MDEFFNDYPPSLVLLKDNTYVRAENLDYWSYVPSEEDPDLGLVQLVYESGNALNVPGVATKDFKRVADTANWYFLQEERKRNEPQKGHA